MRKTKRQLREGFTMTELMVAIGVIVIIGSLLLPAWDSAKRKAQGVKCVGNLRGWGTALSSYIADMGGVYRNWYSGTRTHPDAAQYWTWYMITPMGYTAAELQRTRCPLGPGKISDLSSIHYGFYAADEHGKVVNNPGGQHYEIRMGTHPKPASGILLADSLTSAGVQVHTIFPDRLLARGGIHARHDGKANLYFLDGHVESASPQRLNELGVPKYYDGEGAEKSTPVAK
jgi:prepilin-type processing-associated H-X9-DG protein/prepilin-type N-terminal cleavage/methylation domain-containing protein